MREADEFWEELLAQIEAGQVIPVVGPELLWAAVEGREIAAVPGSRRTPAGEVWPSRQRRRAGRRPRAERYPRPAAALSRTQRRRVRAGPVAAVACRICTARSMSCSRRWWKPPQKPRSSRCGIWLVSPAFRLFVTTTPDDLLARAIDAERHGGMAKTEHIVFAPKLASGTLSDLPEACSSGYTAVCYLFGKASPSPFVFAIHDEDTLEFIHNLQINAGSRA